LSPNPFSIFTGFQLPLTTTITGLFSTAPTAVTLNIHPPDELSLTDWRAYTFAAQGKSVVGLPTYIESGSKPMPFLNTDNSLGYRPYERGNVMAGSLMADTNGIRVVTAGGCCNAIEDAGADWGIAGYIAMSGNIQLPATLDYVVSTFISPADYRLVYVIDYYAEWYSYNFAASIISLGQERIVFKTGTVSGVGAFVDEYGTAASPTITIPAGCSRYTVRVVIEYFDTGANEWYELSTDSQLVWMRLGDIPVPQPNPLTPDGRIVRRYYGGEVYAPPFLSTPVAYI
jgi:hypothetical protein